MNADNPTPDHAQADEHNLVERYHLGRLTAGEEARFEEHLVACGRCQDDLEAVRGLDLGLRTLSARSDAGARPAVAGWKRWGWAAAAALVAMVATSAWFVAGPGFAPGQPGPPALDAPRADTPVFLLSIVRDPSAAPTTIGPATAGEPLALAVYVVDDPRFASYRAVVSTAAGAELWRRDGLRPNALETLMITFPGDFFAPGRYRLRVEGVAAGGAAETVGAYPFVISGGATEGGDGSIPQPQP